MTQRMVRCSTVVAAQLLMAICAGCSHRVSLPVDGTDQETGPAPEGGTGRAEGWAVTAGGPGYEAAYGIAVDKQDNSYVTGQYWDQAVFGTTKLAAVPQGTAPPAGGFLARLDSVGAFSWVTAFDRATGTGVALDAAANVYAAGSFSGSTTFGTITKISKGSADAFVAKLTSSGQVVWVTTVGGPLGDSAGRIAVDASGAACVAGSYMGTVTFGTTTLTARGDTDAFVIKLSPQGEIQWVESLGHTFYDSAAGVAMDGAGSCYVAGSYWGPASIGKHTLPSFGGFDYFVVKLDGTGKVIWARGFGSAENEGSGGMAVDSAGNSYLTGAFGFIGGGTITFGKTKLVTKGIDLFVARLDASGAPVWAVSTSSQGGAWGHAAKLGPNGTLHVVGSCAKQTTFGGFKLAAGRFIDVFRAELDGNGKVLAAGLAGGELEDEGFDVALDSAGRAYIVGRFEGGVGQTARFGSTTLDGKGYWDAFFWRTR